MVHGLYVLVHCIKNYLEQIKHVCVYTCQKCIKLLPGPNYISARWHAPVTWPERLQLCRSGLEVTKAPFANLSIREIFDLEKIPVRL